MKLPQMFASLAFRDFRLLWFSTAFANSGQYAFAVTASWLVFSLSQSTVLVGMTVFASMIPGVVFGPFVGVLVDRFDRKRLLMFSFLLSASNIGCLSVLLTSGVKSPWLIIASAFVLGISFNMQITCTNSLMPAIVPKHSLFNATALQGSVQHGSGFYGSGIASLILMFGGPYAVFYGSFFLYLGALLLSLAIRAQPVADLNNALTPATIFQPIAEGFTYITRKPDLRNLIIIVGAHCFLTMAYMSMMPEHVHHHISSDSTVYSMLMMFVGLGAIVGTLGIASVTSQRRQGKLYIFTALASGLTLFMLAYMHNPELVYVIAFLVGGTQAAFMAINLSFVLERANDEFRGRVASVNFITASGSMALGNFLYGAISKVVPAQTTMAVTGGGFVLLVCLLFMFSDTFRLYYRRRQTEEVPRVSM